MNDKEDKRAREEENQAGFNRADILISLKMQMCVALILLQRHKNVRLWEIVLPVSQLQYRPGIGDGDAWSLRGDGLVAIDLFSYWSGCLFLPSLHCFSCKLPLRDPGLKMRCGDGAHNISSSVMPVSTFGATFLEFLVGRTCSEMRDFPVFYTHTAV